MRFTYPTITPDEFDTRYEADFGTAIVGDPMGEWQPIRDLPSDWQELQDPSLHYLATLREEQRDRLEKTDSYRVFLAQMRRKIAIETGILEQLYSIDRGITYTLIEQGIDASLIPHGTTDKPPGEVVQLIRDHESAIERVFDYVGNNRSLSTSFIKQLHQLLTRNQDSTDAVDQFGHVFQAALIKGDWKTQSNNPHREDGSVHYYAPPEQVTSEMDKLIAWHLRHLEEGVSPEVEAAWLHHRFTQIHPFQDGNGRVARNLATLVLLRARWFPLVIIKDMGQEGKARKEYIESLEQADTGDLKPLVDLVVRAQKQAFLDSLSLSNTVMNAREPYEVALDAVIGKIQAKEEFRSQDNLKGLEQSASELHRLVYDRLDQIKQEISQRLRQSNPGVMVQVHQAQADSPEAAYYFYQIVEIAKHHHYWANRSGYKSWVRLALQIESVQTEILFSLHGVGRDQTGIMMCSAMAWQRLSAQSSAEATTIQSLESLSVEPFDFTYHESQAQITERFHTWLNTVLILAMRYLSEGI
jgi:fido (protein-threonine AMPylation protein)